MATDTRNDRLMEALELLARGAWEAAHPIVQSDKSTETAWIHGVVHMLEGDLENARHWYRKAQREFPEPAALDGEIASAREFLRHDRRHGETASE